MPPLLSHSESASVLILLNQKDNIISIFNVSKIQLSLKNNLLILYQVLMDVALTTLKSIKTLSHIMQTIFSGLDIFVLKN